MEFSLESTTQAALLSRDGALLVNIPSPICYGLHKLLVYGERSEAFRTKSTKDILQSAALISYNAKNDPAALKRTYRDLMERGPGWRKRAKQGIGALVNLDPVFGTLPDAARGAARRMDQPAQEKGSRPSTTISQCSLNSCSQVSQSH